MTFQCAYKQCYEYLNFHKVLQTNLGKAIYACLNLNTCWQKVISKVLGDMPIKLLQ